MYWRNEITTIINRLREVEPKYTFQEEHHAMVNSNDMYDPVINYPETPIPTESNVWSTPLEQGYRGGGDGAPISHHHPRQWKMVIIYVRP